MTKYLIVNSDDYCRTPGVSAGIRDAYKNGIVRSTTCMMNMPWAADDIGLLLEETPGLQMGVHLVLTSGKPLLSREEVGTLVDEDGNFRGYDPFVEHLPQIDPNEVLAEWRAQINLFRQVSGRKPTHLDSHHHSSYFIEPLFERMLILAEEEDCPVRYLFEWPDNELNGIPPQVYDDALEYLPRLFSQSGVRRPDNFISSFYDTSATQVDLSGILRIVPEMVSELMCHPGYADDEIVRGSIYARQRQWELEILTSKVTREAIKDQGIELISFADLKEVEEEG